MEVGRHSVIGPGELWMGTEDPLIAQNMHTTIIGYVLMNIFFWCRKKKEHVDLETLTIMMHNQSVSRNVQIPGCCDFIEKKSISITKTSSQFSDSFLRLKNDKYN